MKTSVLLASNGSRAVKALYERRPGRTQGTLTGYGFYDNDKLVHQVTPAQLFDDMVPDWLGV